MPLRRTPRSLEERVADLEEKMRRTQGDDAITPTDLRLVIEARGDLIVGVDDGIGRRLGVGADGEVLTARPSAALGMAWEAFTALAVSLLTAKGDLIVGGEGGEPSTLGVGADGEVLTADSSTPLGQRWASSSTADAEALVWLTMTEGT